MNRITKHLLVGVLSLWICGSALCVSDGYTKKEVWNKDLKKGMPEAVVRKLLGEPKREVRESYRLVFYYQPTEYTVKSGGGTRMLAIEYEENKTIEISDVLGIGSLVLINKIFSEGRRPKNAPNFYVLDRWENPDFTKMELQPKEKPKRLKPKRPIKKWEHEKNWSRLKFYMLSNAVENILGEPDKVDASHGTEFTYYYGDISQSAYLNFRTIEGVRYLQNWKEPYWFFLNEELYEEVKEENEPNKP